MLARISFDSGQQVSTEEHRAIEQVLSDEVSVSKMCKGPDGDVTSFYSWSHTFDPEKANDKLQLVTEVDVLLLESGKEYLADVQAFMQKFPKIKFKMRGVFSSPESHASSMLTQMNELNDKIQRALQSFNEKVEFNQRCEVHVPNLGMLHINELGFATDKCTEELQQLLNVGWRIVAVCPQPDQRRPDYILGRFNSGDNDDVRCHKF